MRAKNGGGGRPITIKNVQKYAKIPYFSLFSPKFGGGSKKISKKRGGGQIFFGKKWAGEEMDYQKNGGEETDCPKNGGRRWITKKMGGCRDARPKAARTRTPLRVFLAHSYNTQ